MRNFDYGKLKDALWSSEIVGLVAQIRFMQGKQNRYFEQKPDEVARLVEIAKVQSTEASNAIEGIRTTDTRLRRLVEAKATPKNRAEEDIAGYRDVLNLIHESYDYIPLTPNYILQLHQIMYSHSVNSGVGGKFKSVQNYITATDADGNSVTLFTPLPPYETPEAVEKICAAFNNALAYGESEPLVLIPVFIHDFLCIHPFLNGNGRMSRLLTTLLLYRCGFYVGKYISLEAEIARSKDRYYDALAASGNGWLEGKEDASPFVAYLLTTVLAAYRDLDKRVEIVTGHTSALDMVRKAASGKVGKFVKSDMIALCPSLSKSSVEKALAELTAKGEIVMHGSGKSTFYTRG